MPILIVFAFALPFLLWPIESIFSGNLYFGVIIEEIAKFILLYNANKNLKQGFLKYSLILGSAFFLTETVFYLTFILSSGSGELLGPRFLLTLPMHLLTSLLLAVGLISNNKSKSLIGLFFAITIHLLFNLLVKRLGV